MHYRNTFYIGAYRSFIYFLIIQEIVSAPKKNCQIQHDEGIGKQRILAVLQKRLTVLNRGVQVTEHRLSDQRNQAGMNCMVETKNTERPYIWKSHSFIQTSQENRKDYYGRVGFLHVR